MLAKLLKDWKLGRDAANYTWADGNVGVDVLLVGCKVYIRTSVHPAVNSLSCLCCSPCSTKGAVRDVLTRKGIVQHQTASVTLEGAAEHLSAAFDQTGNFDSAAQAIEYLRMRKAALAGEEHTCISIPAVNCLSKPCCSSLK